MVCVRMAVMEVGRVVGFCIYCRDKSPIGNRYSISSVQSLSHVQLFATP